MVIALRLMAQDRLNHWIYGFVNTSVMWTIRLSRMSLSWPQSGSQSLWANSSMFLQKGLMLSNSSGLFCYRSQFILSLWNKILLSLILSSKSCLIWFFIGVGFFSSAFFSLFILVWCFMNSSEQIEKWVNTIRVASETQWGWIVLRDAVSFHFVKLSPTLVTFALLAMGESQSGLWIL